MTSKKSFLVSIKTNLRRRVWLMVIMVLVLTFTLPVLTALILSSEKMYYSYSNVSMHLGFVFTKHVGLNGGIAFLVAVLAILSAIQGFSYMYQRKKLDMYMSVPIAKEKRFFSIYLNGILVFLVPYLLSVGLSFLVAQTMGANILPAVGEAAAAIIGNIIFYLAIYHVTILAVMLTGNMIITLMATGVMLFYDAILLMLLIGYQSTFFTSYYYRSDEHLDKFFISPVSRLAMTFDKCLSYDNGYDYSRTLLWGEYVTGMLPIVVWVMITFGLAYWCYTRKPSEACGKAMAFSKTKAPVKVLLIIAAGLAGGIIFYSFSGRSMPFLVFGMLAGVLLCHGIIEVIYEFDIRSVKNGWKSLLVSGAAVTAIFSIFCFDLTGYDKYVPAPEEVDSLAFIFIDGNYDSFYDENFEATGSEEYAFEHMEIVDVQPVLQLAELRMGIDGWKWNGEDGERYRQCVVKYRLKNGKEIYRRFPTAYETDVALLDEIVTDIEYQKATSTVYNDALFALGNKLELKYDNGSERKDVTTFSLAELRSAYEKDLAEFTYGDMIQEKVQGVFRMEKMIDGEYIYSNLPVYPSFARVNALLQKAGMTSEAYVKADDVAKVIVMNSNSEMYELFAQEGYTMYHSYEVEETFEKKEEIEEILEGVYPDSFTDYWMPYGEMNTDFYVTVIYKADNELSGGSYTNYYMLDKKIPDYVRERTKYTGGAEGNLPKDEVLMTPTVVY